MRDQAIVTTGLTGTVMAVICCASPVLVLLFGAVGLSAWVGGLDYVLFPALALFLAILASLAYGGLWRSARTQAHPGHDRQHDLIPEGTVHV